MMVMKSSPSEVLSGQGITTPTYQFILISILYIALFADDPKHLQNMLNAFQQYCTNHDLIINPTKCEVVVFGDGKAWPHYSWRVNGNALTTAKHFKYLEVTLAGSRDIKACVEHRLQSMTRAQACVRRRLLQLHLPSEPFTVQQPQGGLTIRLCATAGAAAAKADGGRARQHSMLRRMRLAAWGPAQDSTLQCPCPMA
jgi:hypothetical protein